MQVTADAPGRVNLIGEHTDYQDGFVMPSAVPQRTSATLTRRTDRIVHVTSTAVEGRIEYELGSERPGLVWGDYVQGLTWVLGAGGHPLAGFDLHLRSDVPLGSGLSSSAALEVSVLRALRAAFDLPLTDIEIAQLGQRAEVQFVGAPVGIMDQMASSLAAVHEALFLDTRTLAFERIPLPASLELVVIDSGVAHGHAAGDYAVRRRESEEAARLLGVSTLRDASLEAVKRLSGMPPLLARRARHVITENARVLDARQALAAGDLEELGRLVNASHASLRDDYEVSIAPVDLLVETARRQPGVFGARMTGGGFGGAVVIAAARGAGPRVAEAVAADYLSRTGTPGRVLIPGRR